MNVFVHLFTHDVAGYVYDMYSDMTLPSWRFQHKHGSRGFWRCLHFLVRTWVMGNGVVPAFGRKQWRSLMAERPRPRYPAQAVRAERKRYALAGMGKMAP